MREFVIACVAAIVAAIGAFYILGSAQEPAGVAFTMSTTARTDPSWSWRQPVSTLEKAPGSSMSKMSGASEGACPKPGPWSYFKTDVYGTITADPLCT